MNIAMLTWESMHSVAVGGVAAHVSDLSAALHQAGHRVSVFTRRGPGQPFYSRIDGVHYYRCFYPGHSDFVEDVNNMCRSFVDHVFEVEDRFGPFDVVHAHDWLVANAMIWIKQGRKRTGVITIHSTEYGRCGNEFYDGQSERIRSQERAGIQWADRVIAVSGATSLECQWMYSVPAQKITAIGNGIDASRFDIQLKPLASDRRQPVVLFCGRITMQKGPDILVRAIPAILSVHPNTRFVLAGEGDMRESLERHVGEMGVSGSTRFVGRRGGEQLLDLYHTADLVCVPSRNEPFGIVVLEAWSARKPVVVTDTGGPREFVRHEVNGLKTYPISDSVAWGVRMMLDHPGRSRWMGENGRKLVESDYGWAEIARRTELVYDPDAAGRFEVPDEELSTVCEDGESNAVASRAPVSDRIHDWGLKSCVVKMTKSPAPSPTGISPAVSIQGRRCNSCDGPTARPACR